MIFYFKFVMQTKMYNKLNTDLMKRTSPSREINQRLMLTIHQDGLLDILAGLIIATFGTIPLLDASGINPGVRQVIFLSCYLVEVVALLWLKRTVTLPRTGQVTLSRRTTTRLSVTMLIINGLIFLFFAGTYLFKLPVRHVLGSFQLSISLGMIFFILFSAAGWMLRATRFFFYAALVLAAFILAEYLAIHGNLKDHGIPLASFFSGGVIVCTGVVQLVHFMNTYKIDN